MGVHEDIAACAASHGRLLAAVQGLTDADVQAPSLLPDWTVGHVLTHVARNADSVVRRLVAAVEHRQVPQYEGGAEGRAAAIEAGSGRPATELLADLVDACTAVDDLLPVVGEEVWTREVLAGNGPSTVPASRLVYSRWREVEVHHVDLGRGYGPADWPPELDQRMLPELLETLPSRADAAALLAWAAGRGPAPELAPWG
jgi:maleylpyruvate isomerase